MHNSKYLKLRDWVNRDAIDWWQLSLDPKIIFVLEHNLDKINWTNLSINLNAISILEKNIDKICWYYLSSNPNAIPILEKNLDKIDWYNLSSNPNALSIIENNFDKIDSISVLLNPCIFTYDYDKIKKNRKKINVEIHKYYIRKWGHPNKLTCYLGFIYFDCKFFIIS